MLIHGHKSTKTKFHKIVSKFILFDLGILSYTQNLLFNIIGYFLLAFIFKRKDIGKYLLFCMKGSFSNDEVIKSKTENISFSFSIHMQDYKINNYSVNIDKLLIPGVNWTSDQFVIVENGLQTTLKNWNQLDQYIYKRFIKTENCNNK